MERGTASLLSTLMTQEILLLLLVPSLLAAFITLGFAMRLHQSTTTLSQGLEQAQGSQREQAAIIATLQAELEQAQGSQREQAAIIVTLQAANDALRAELEDAQRRLREQAATIVTLQNQPPLITGTPSQTANDALRGELEDAQRRLREHAETITALQAANDALRGELEDTQRRLREHAETITALQAANDALRAEIATLNDQPPIITLAETEARFRFPLGSAELSPTFRESLSKEVVPQILRAQHKYRINTVQVIGHTDEVPLSNPASTLDKSLIPFIWGSAAIAPGSNIDLAMLRAVAVLKVLRAHPELQDLNLVPYSAGQVLLPGEVLASGQEKGQNPDRRRVVIRLTRS